METRFDSSPVTKYYRYLERESTPFELQSKSPLYTLTVYATATHPTTPVFTLHNILAVTFKDYQCSTGVTKVVG